MTKNAAQQRGKALNLLPPRADSCPPVHCPQSQSPAFGIGLMLAYGEVAALNPTARLPQPPVFPGIEDPDLDSKTQSAANADDFARIPILVEAMVASLRLDDIVNRRAAHSSRREAEPST